MNTKNRMLEKDWMKKKTDDVGKMRSPQDNLQSRYHITVHCVNTIEKQNNTNQCFDKNCILGTDYGSDNHAYRKNHSSDDSLNKSYVL